MHYKKDGSLDMRYSSSKASVSSGSYGSNRVSYASHSNTPAHVFMSPSSQNSAMHYKNDGSLDMRYSSSKVAVQSSRAPMDSPAASNSSLHYKIDGSLDMRYSSSKAAISSPIVSSPSNAATTIHLKKDGTPDMRFNTSKVAVSSPSQPAPIRLKPLVSVWA